MKINHIITSARLIWTAVFLVPTLAACSEAINPVIQAETPVPTLHGANPTTENSTLPFLSSPALTGTYTSVPTKTIPAPTRTLAFTATPTPSRTPIPTVVPTLLPNQKRDRIIHLLTEPACTLPCWWGIVPGQTTWQEANTILRPIANIINNLGTFDQHSTYAVDFDIQENIQQNGKLYQGYMVQDGIVIMIQLNPGNTNLTTPAKALELFGPPDEVWIRTLNSSPHDDILFDLALYYSDKGILIFYDYRASLNINEGQGIENVKVCFTASKDNPRMLLLPLEQNAQFPDLAKIIKGSTEAPFYKKLEDVTNMSVEEFYTIYTDSSKSSCLETPAKLWPNPGQIFPTPGK